ncbi:MAG: SUMF1/EgtB/PvdO family nonheme iron enzyme [Anaerolineales bacterium]|nr:SUMF1/EgtB/PvdO family nonheme iron enzyme [Anaerolineales bacterium]
MKFGNKWFIALFLFGMWFTGCDEGREALTFEVEKLTPSPLISVAVTNVEEIPEINLPVGDTQQITENDDARVVLVQEGSFLMGADAVVGLEICEKSRSGCELADFRDEGPVHSVYLDEFWIGQFEVTNSEYRLCVAAGKCVPPAIQEFYSNPIFDNHPVVFVSWYQADAYCRFVGGLLPTEAQWEKAARGSDERVFPWGNMIECGHANLRGCTEGLTLDVGSFPSGASSYGVLDLAGNAAEWVADWYSTDYYANSPEENPTGPVEGEMKVARGGSWKNLLSGGRATNRTANFPEVFSSGVGFRCVYLQQP